MGRRIFPLFGELPAYDRRGRLREHGADDKCHRGTQPRQPKYYGDDDGCQYNLRCAKTEDLVAHCMELRK